MQKIARNILSGAAAAVFLFLMQALPVGASDGTVDLCATHNPDESIQCSSPNRWCGNTCQAQPTPTATQDINCSNCTTICAPATPCSYPTCTAATSTSGVTSCTGNGSCPANGGVFTDQCSTSTGCPAGKTLCPSPRSCATTVACAPGFTFNACANGGLGACESPYVVLNPPVVQTGDVNVAGDFYLSNGSMIHLDDTGVTELTIGNVEGPAANLRVLGRIMSGTDSDTPEYPLDVKSYDNTAMLNIADMSGGLWTGTRLARGSDEKWFVGMDGSTDDLRFNRTDQQTEGYVDFVMRPFSGVGGGMLLTSDSADPTFKGLFQVASRSTVANCGFWPYGPCPPGHPDNFGSAAAEDGAMYYNTTMAKFRCYEDGEWKDCISQGLFGSGVAGQATFWTASDTIASDPNFVWDNTNKRLGIGIAPNHKLQIFELINFDNARSSTSLGDRAGRVNAGSNNTFLGWVAGTVNSTGYQNTALGSLAMQSNTTGFLNTAVGEHALSNNIGGSYSTGAGAYALAGETSGGQNTGVGFRALMGVTTGSYNTALGVSAGYYSPANAVTTGSSNIFIGFQSAQGTSTQLTNATAIGSDSRVSASNSMTLGNSSVKVGITEPIPGYRLDVRDDSGAGGTAMVRINQNNATKLYTGTRIDRLSVEKWFTGMNATDDKFRIRRTGSADAVIIEDTTGNMNVNGGGLSTNAGDATMFANTVETGKMCLGNASTGSESFCRTSWPPVLGSFVGLSAGSTGSAGGYVGANAVCNTAFAGSHVCSVTEILNTVNTAVAAYFGLTNGTDMWINGGPPGYTAPANDCVGWTDAGGTKFGRKWRKEAVGGGGTLTFCDQSIQFACCQ